MQQEPRNPFMNILYRGGNIERLVTAQAERGYKTAIWATMKQWSRNGYKVPKSEWYNYVRCQNWHNVQKVEKNRKTGKYETVAKKGHIVFNLFNRDQVVEVRKDCPHCHGPIGTMPALSRTDNCTRICNQCATLEALKKN